MSNINKCKICRRLQQKMFLKGEKCLSPKCSMIRRPYPPGAERKKNRGKLSEYGKELAEKQKLRNYYGLSERQFRGYITDVLKKRGGDTDAVLVLIRKLEKRLDNVVFRLGFARSRREARVLVSHKHFLVNNKSVNVASFATKKNDKITIKEAKKNKANFKDLAHFLKNYQPPAWLNLDKEKMEGEVKGEPDLVDMESAVDISAIFEFYSR
ncbi:30S ribosomal protein S4 [bacterium (Candidatus Gribaldobacteria) CG08_land_8_20_14_0_20_39_15]|uniref:Small ribosomal subunit protein uS4 n=1 Tax=bacterium (Candidatus Gribaldobacteria) CG08_land_8_20_14_0_20_39_15 TaxID=2014273 RepID=A0A2M6XV61_9BACT|nr:MAG: 30S ribosomal protein S4 [bacterium (Candidatus Gribaldobacteria) CG08_land_8_20_14_0_20_39_15]